MLTNAKKILAQEALIYKPEERIWINLEMQQENSVMESLKSNLMLHLLGKLYFVSKNATFTFDYESNRFEERNHLVQQEDILNLSMIYANG